MPPDRPDYETNSNIAAQTVGNLAVEIAAQTISQLGVDIQSQSVGDVAVDLATQSLSQLDVDIQSQTVGDLAVDIATQSVNDLGIDIQAQSISDLGIDIQSQSLSQVQQDQQIQSSEGVETRAVTDSSPISSGGTSLQTISPGSGQVFELQGLQMRVRDPPSTSSGTHSIEVRVGTSPVNILFAKANHDVPIRYNSGTFFQSYQTTRPSTNAAQEAATSGIRFDGNDELQFRYENNTLTTTSIDRDYAAVFRRITTG
jgi:hypothetical protein